MVSVIILMGRQLQFDESDLIFTMIRVSNKKYETMKELRMKGEYL